MSNWIMQFKPMLFKGQLYLQFVFYLQGQIKYFVLSLTQFQKFYIESSKTYLLYKTAR